MHNRSASIRRIPSLLAAVAVAAGASVAMADTMKTANPERAGSSASTSGSYGATGNRGSSDAARSSNYGPTGTSPSTSASQDAARGGMQGGASYGTSGTRGSSTTNYSDTANATSSPTYSPQARDATQGTSYGSSTYGTEHPSQSSAPVNATTGEANFHDGRAPVRPGMTAPAVADTSGPKTRKEVHDEVLRARMTGQLLTTNPAIAWAPAHIDVNTYHGETSMASREQVRQEARDALRNQQGNPSRDYRLGSPSVIPQQPTANAGNAAE